MRAVNPMLLPVSLCACKFMIAGEPGSLVPVAGLPDTLGLSPAFSGLP